MTAPLKPCPFCGGTKIDGGYNEYGGFVSICANCDTYGPPAAEMSKDAIIAAWNTRADAPELLALVDAAKAVDHDTTHGNGLEGFRKNRERLHIALSAYEALQ